jgi:hypothetical protein
MFGGPKIQKVFDEVLEQNRVMQRIEADRLTLRVEKVSKWCVGQHLEHLAITGLAVMNRIEGATANPPPNVNEKLTGLGIGVLMASRIPRGVADAPEFIKPSQDLKNYGELMSKWCVAFEPLGKRLDELEKCPGKMPHPVAGFLTCYEWLRFLQIHQQHHLDIIRDMEV